MTLRALREVHGLTQEEVASRTDFLRQSDISRLERGAAVNPTIATMEALARAYQQPLDVVVTALRETVAEAAA